MQHAFDICQHDTIAADLHLIVGATEVLDLAVREIPNEIAGAIEPPARSGGVWVGNDLKTQTIGKGADGARTALPIWIRILEAMKDHGRIDPQEDFDVPANIVFTPVDYETGLKATADTPLPVLEAFVSGSQPTEEWNPRSQEISKLPWSLQQPFYVPKKGEGAESVEAEPTPTRKQ